jgi:hypothetical protein
MATRSELFRYQAERSGSKKRTAGERGETAATHGKHEPVRAGKKAVWALEDSAGRPSRKSTRKASNRQKTDVQFRMKQQTAEMRPRVR